VAKTNFKPGVEGGSKTVATVVVGGGPHGKSDFEAGELPVGANKV